MEIVAPLSGTVEAVSVAAGDQVVQGQLLLTLESMKVHVQITTERAGLVKSVLVDKSHSVERDDVLIILETTADVAPDFAATVSNTQQTRSEHKSISEFKQRTTLTSDEHRDKARQKRYAKGYRTARENLASLCPLETFQEYGQLAVAAQRSRVDYDALKTDTAADGIITGIGQVNQNLFANVDTKTALVVNDYSVLAGTQGYFHHLKLDRILELASRQKRPIIMFTEGGGGRPGDTDVNTVNSGLQCQSFSTWAGLSGIVPRITVANGYNFAGNAALFGAGDITIATKTSWIGMAGPAMIAGGGLGKVKATDIGPIEVQAANGVVDVVADDESQAAELAKQALSYFQGEVSDWQAHDQQSLRSVMPANRKLTYAIRDVIEQIADIDSFLELKRLFGGSVIIGFMRIQGKPLGIIANDCAVLGGAIDVEAGEKAAEFMQLCSQFQIPMVSFCDTPGFMVGPAHEEQGAVRRLAKLFTTGAQFSDERSRTKFVAIVLRKCYGLGAQAMLGGNTQRPDAMLAWPSGEFGAMGLEGAVSLGFKKELDAAKDPTEKQALFDTLLTQQYQRGQAVEVASVLELDAVIDPADTRASIAKTII